MSTVVCYIKVFIEAAEDLLQNHKKDVTIVSLDIKSYYPTASLDYSKVNKDLKIRLSFTI